MSNDELREWSRKAAGWVYDDHTALRDQRRLPDDTTAAPLPADPPEQGEDVQAILDDLARMVTPAATPSQGLSQVSRLPADALSAAALADILTGMIAAQGMLWHTAPAATRIEQAMCGWLVQALGLPGHFHGTIHESASTATLSAMLTMRARAHGGQANDVSEPVPIRLYAGAEAPASVDKVARIAGIGQADLVRVATGPDLALRPEALDAAIVADRAAGRVPAGVVLCAGSTPVGAFDRIGDCVAVARAHGVPVHVDAAWAGSAMVAPEFRHLWAGIEGADSIVFNPQKWLGSQFDCAVQFLADPGPLGTPVAQADRPEAGRLSPPEFNEWTVPQGRRFRALKLWFLMRAYGLDGWRGRIRNHVGWAQAAAAEIARMPGVDMVTGPSLSQFSFALAAGDEATEALLHQINDDGRIHLAGAHHRGRFVIRVQVGSFDCMAEDVAMVPQVVAEMAEKVAA